MRGAPAGVTTRRRLLPTSPSFAGETGCGSAAALAVLKQVNSPRHLTLMRDGREQKAGHLNFVGDIWDEPSGGSSLGGQEKNQEKSSCEFTECLFL